MSKDELIKLTGKGKSRIVKYKKKKDPNAPKRGLSSYMCFCRDVRPKVSEKYDTIAEIGREMGRMWRALPEKEKAKYKAISDAERKEYAKKMIGYSPPPTEYIAIKKKRTPSDVKRPRSAYVFFVKDSYHTTAKKHPDITRQDIIKMIGAQWKKMSESQKTKYNKMATEDKTRYVKEKKN